MVEVSVLGNEELWGGSGQVMCYDNEYLGHYQVCMYVMIIVHLGVCLSSNIEKGIMIDH